MLEQGVSERAGQPGDVCGTCHLGKVRDVVHQSLQGPGFVPECRPSGRVGSLRIGRPKVSFHFPPSEMYGNYA